MYRVAFEQLGSVEPFQGGLLAGCGCLYLEPLMVGVVLTSGVVLTR